MAKLSQTTPDRADILDRLRSLGIWKRGDERAPHKPLLLLLAFARASRGENPEMPFRRNLRCTHFPVVQGSPRRHIDGPEGSEFCHEPRFTPITADFDVSRPPTDKPLQRLL